MSSTASSAPGRPERHVRVLAALIGISYPFLVYAVLTLLEPRVLVVLLGVVVLSRLVLNWRHARLADISRLAVPLGLVATVLLLAGIFNDGRFFLFVPALVNAGLLIGFLRTLLRGPSMIETFARFGRHDLPEGAVPYCRRVTWLWCAFFVINITISLWLALASSLERWTAYNGFVAYVLVGILLGAERVYRYWRFRVYDGGVLDQLFRRLFPPRAPRSIL